MGITSIAIVFWGTGWAAESGLRAPIADIEEVITGSPRADFCHRWHDTFEVIAADAGEDRLNKPGVKTCFNAFFRAVALVNQQEY